MNETGSSLSVVGLFENADIVVKFVLLLLLAGSIWSWTVIVEKLFRLRAARRSTSTLTARAAEARTVEELVGERHESDQPAGAVLVAGVEECIAFADDSAESMAERRERIDRAMRLALGAQLRQLEL